jgi:hypothetical protein
MRRPVGAILFAFLFITSLYGRNRLVPLFLCVGQWGVAVVGGWADGGGGAVGVGGGWRGRVVGDFTNGALVAPHFSTAFGVRNKGLFFREMAK